MLEYIEHPDNNKKSYPDKETVIYYSQGKYYNVNPKHVHLTWKICWGKSHIATKFKYIDPNYYNNKRANNSENTKRNSWGTTNTNTNDETNQQITQYNAEEIQQSRTQNEEQSQVTAPQLLTVSIINEPDNYYNNCLFLKPSYKWWRWKMSITSSPTKEVHTKITHARHQQQTNWWNEFHYKHGTK